MLKRYRETLFGIAPILVIVGGVAILQKGFYDYLRTSIDKTVTGLAPATMYLLDHRHQPCVGEVVRYKSKKMKGFGYYKIIAAGSGSKFSVSETGYVLDGQSKDMPEAWVKKAQAEGGENGKTFEIPASDVLIINTEFDGESKRRNWAYEILPRTNIETTVTRVIFSREMSDIGTPITTRPEGCSGA